MAPGGTLCPVFAYPPRQHRRRPAFNGRELHVHAHRDWPGISADERELVIAFLTRYVVWCGKARRFDRLRNAVDLLVDVAGR